MKLGSLNACTLAVVSALAASSLPIDHEAAHAATPNVIAAITRQDAEGLTEAGMDLTFLRNLEAYFATTMSRKIAAQGVRGVRPIPEGVYTYIEGKKVAVVKVRISNVRSTAFIVGIVGEEAVRVSCAVRGSEVVLTSGPCAIKIREAFGGGFGT